MQLRLLRLTCRSIMRGHSRFPTHRKPRLMHTQALGGRAAAQLAGEESTGGAHRTFGTLGLGTFAQLLSMALEQQVGSDARVEALRDFVLNRLLRFTISNTVVFTLASLPDSHQHMRTVRRNCSDRRNFPEEEDAVSAGIGDVGKRL